MNKASLIKAVVALSILGLPLVVNMHQNIAFANSQGIVMADALNVRAAADNSSKIIGLVHKGDTFEIFQTKNNWDEIKLANNEYGWVYDPYIAINGTTEAKVDAVVLRVHNAPNLFSTVVGKLRSGSKITINDEQAGWAKIVSSSGVHGWVSERYITKEAASSKPVAVRPAAKSVTESGDTPVNKSVAKSGDTPVNKAFTESGDMPVNKSVKKPAVPPAATKAATANPADLGVTSSSPSSDQPIPDDGMLTEQSVTIEAGPANLEPLKGKTIILDPGHGGKDDGTTSITGTTEKALTLKTAQAVEQKLQNAGANVVMTRSNDTYIPLEQRAGLSNQDHADAFISFHYNWSDDQSVTGLTDFYYRSPKDDPLAADILNEVAKATGLKDDGTKFDNLEVLRDNTRPSTLIELGFLSNKQDVAAVENPSYYNNVAQGVYQGLLDYFSK